MLKKIRIYALLAVSILTWISAYADDASNSFSDEFEATLSTPKVPLKHQSQIKTYMYNVAKNLYNEKFMVETMRNGEVVVVTIPLDKLFTPNEFTLIESAPKLLDRFRQYFSPPETFKIVLAVHSDNTGSESYLNALTEGRINALLDYFEEKGLDVTNVVGFPMADSMPIDDNDSRAGRAANRRLEIFIIPDNGLIKKQKK